MESTPLAIGQIGMLNGRYILLSRLGYGGFSKVYLGHISGEPTNEVAIKIPRTKKHSTSFRKALDDEVKTMKDSVHEHVVGLIDYGNDGIFSEEGLPD